MFPFWDPVIAPLVKAANARRVLEIGALRGETTARMFDQLGPSSELHVIDPLPQFDPEEHEREFPGRYVFHRDLSLNVLGDLPHMDVALIDGDHNWYTVYHELKALDATSKREGKPLPLLALHDVAWPYGHRDLYYEPSQIPDEFRQPWKRQGIVPGFFRLVEEGGANAELANAIDGGGPRNGVMCALEDFLSEHDKPYRLLVLPFYFGLAIVVEEERLEATPAVGRILDSIDSKDGWLRMLKVSERIRIDSVVMEHNVGRTSDRRVARQRDRYLKLLKDALLNRHYLHDEVRVEYLASRPEGSEIDPAALRDPTRTLWVRYKRLSDVREAGRTTDEPLGDLYDPYTDMGRAALDHLEASVVHLDREGVEGDLVECGVSRGGGAIFMRGMLDAYEIPDRNVWLVDPFLATEPGGTDGDHSSRARLRADLNQVRDGFDRFDLLDDRVKFLHGPYGEVLADHPIEKIALLRVGVDAAFDLATVLGRLLPRMAPGGTVILEGVGRQIVADRLNELRARLNLGALDRIDWNNVSWQVEEPPTEEDVDLPERPLRRVPLIRRRDADQADHVDLSVIVVFYNMARESARTLLSLSRSYQRGIDDLSYEVIAIDNGSDPDQRLKADEVAGYGPEFRLVTIEDAQPSPTTALNRGLAESKGDAVAVMIDGAHVLTPGVFKRAMDAMRTYTPAIVGIQQWYVGPGQQGDAQQAGYDQSAEDKLFKAIRWPTDGYRLFEIGHFIGDRDWFDGMVESNCLFAPRSTLEQIGGFDDSFDMPGGGYANLELWERLHHHPGITPTSVLGEGTFHQFHGGTTTNVADEAVRRERVASYGQHFREQRGRPLQGLTKSIHYVGAMDSKAARRTRSRREIKLRFAIDRDPVEDTAIAPQPVPEEIKFAAIEALWENQSWRGATWLGRPVARFPTDLHAYQELLASARPDVVILIADDNALGGRAAFFAGVQDQIGVGRVIAVGAGSEGDRPDHPRVTYLVGRGDEADAAEQIEKLLGDETACVFIGLGSKQRVVRAFERYAPLVNVGGYVVLENTVLNGRPAAPDFGPGPHEAVADILARHPDFVPDPTYERYTITFNKNGYLRRMS
ncbi:MAG: class I SAM-dependent methyltransferase [Acidimicrobiales bacterium]|nr:class I SAM-dependent methyltransferase [Acidimicrobiales bacterium]